MSIENIVASLEMCKKMQEAGIDFGETAFVWVKKVDGFKLVLRDSIIGGRFAFVTYFSAPTASEIWSKLPIKIIHKKNEVDHYLTLEKQIGINADGTCYKTNLVGYYYGGRIDKKIGDFEHKILVEALSALCLWVKENKYVRN